MTIDLFDDVLGPFIIGFVVIAGLTVVGGLVYILIKGNILALIFIMTVLIMWAIGFPLWRKYKYG